MAPQDVWRRKNDEEVAAAVAQLDEYTESGRELIIAEAERRGIKVERRVPNPAEPLNRPQGVVDFKSRWLATLVGGLAVVAIGLWISSAAGSLSGDARAGAGFLVALCLYGTGIVAAREKGISLLWAIWSPVPFVLAWLLLAGYREERKARLTWGRTSTGSLRKLLPQKVKCPDCKADLELTLQERASAQFKCKQCGEDFSVDD